MLGQSDFTMSAANDDDQDGSNDSTPSARVFNPLLGGVYLNGDRLFVADTYNYRVLIFEKE